MGKSNRVKARLLKGMQDAGPELALARSRALRAVEPVCLSYGYLPYDTPAMEEVEALLGPDPTKEQLASIFHFVNHDGVHVGLRYEMTGSLARLVSQYRNELAMPFRRYQVGPAWRWDKPEPGRFREFLQFDIDTVGSGLMLADAEIVAVITAILKALSIERFMVRISSRKLLNGLGEFIGAGEDKARGIYRVIDKLDKFDRARIRLELGEGLVDDSGDPIPGLGLSTEQIAKVDEFLDLPNTGDAVESIAAVRSLMGGNEQVATGLTELEQLMEYLPQFGVDGQSARIDLHLARGLGYYDGPVFEAVLKDQPEFGSIFGGGRYDGLMERFLGKGQGIPAVGASCGIDRLLAAREAQGELKTERVCADVLVTVMDRSRNTDYIAMASELRNAGIRAELYLAKGNLGKQLKYADKLGIPLAVVAGSDEFDKGEVQIKNLEAGKKISESAEDREAWLAHEAQKSYKREELVNAVKEMLGQ